jgi:CBS domain-containing protein
VTASARARPAPQMALHARTAGELMTANPLSIRQAATVGEAACSLTSRGISAVPVIDEPGRPVGVVSRSDLLNHRAHGDLHLLDAPNEGPPPSAAGGCDGAPQAGRPGHPSVGDVMTPGVFCVRPETAAGKVVEKTLALRVRHLFVVDQGGVLVGIISAFDVLRNRRPQWACCGLGRWLTAAQLLRRMRRRYLECEQATDTG